MDRDHAPGDVGTDDEPVQSDHVGYNSARSRDMQSLHTNFYEIQYPREFIEDGAPSVEELTARLERL
jgi:hypothetical protein